MVLAAFIFGIAILSISLFFLLFYVQSHRSMRENQYVLARQRERQLKFQAELQARMEAEARRYEEERQALLKHARGGDDEREPRNVGHAA